MSFNISPARVLKALLSERLCYREYGVYAWYTRHSRWNKKQIVPSFGFKLEGERRESAAGLLFFFFIRSISEHLAFFKQS